MQEKFDKILVAFKINQLKLVAVKFSYYYENKRSCQSRF